VAFVEGARGVVLGMHHERADAGDIRRLHCSEHGVFQQSRAKSLALPIDSDGKPRQQHDRNRMAGETFFEPIGSVVERNLPDRECVESNHLFIVERDIGSRCAGLLVLPRVAVR